MNKQGAIGIVQTDRHLDDETTQRISNQQKTRYLDRVAGARRYIDQDFIAQFGVPAYPHLDILLIMRLADSQFDVQHIAEQLQLTLGVTTRYLNLMSDLGLIDMDRSGVRLRDAGWQILFNLVDQNLSNSFAIVE